MNFYFYSPISFEKWDYRNSVEKGIGGSETSHVEMSWRLAARGHNVITFANIPDDCNEDWRGTKWYSLDKADFTKPGIWILYRCPEVVDKFDHKRTDQQIWLMMQDWDYPQWNEERIKHTDKIITLCKAHGRDVIEKHPSIKKNLWLSSNGLKLDLLEETEKKRKIKRNPKKIMYASSPDRGLKQALLAFSKAREIVPDIELHAFYGFNNLKKLIQGNEDTAIGKVTKELYELVKLPGVNFHGRVSQADLYKHWLSAGVWIYCTNFYETSCITSMEAQACGAIPLFSPIFAQRENIRHGVQVEGDANDPLTQARFAAEIIRLTHAQPQIQDAIRPQMMEEARQRFNWENFVTQWELEAEGKRDEFEKRFSFPQQL